jgi:hypothetical protein
VDSKERYLVALKGVKRRSSEAAPFESCSFLPPSERKGEHRRSSKSPPPNPRTSSLLLPPLSPFSFKIKRTKSAMPPLLAIAFPFFPSSPHAHRLKEELPFVARMRSPSASLLTKCSPVEASPLSKPQSAEKQL